MSITSASVVKCEVHLPHTHFYPGDAVEGALLIDAAAAFDVFNIHIKIVGKEEVSAMVDQVKQSKIKNVQFGISSQDYVYYREIVTLAGSLMTEKGEAQKKKKQRRNDKEGEQREEPVTDDEDDVGAAGEGSTRDRENDRVEVADDGDDDDNANVFRYNESVCVRPGVQQQNRSFAISQLATEEGVSVRFPAGHFVYPFRFLLPASLPPSYDTGIRVKDGQYSNSQAALHYYVKAYVWSPSRVELASARADFHLGAMQPDYGCGGGAAAADKSNSANADVNNTPCKQDGNSKGDQRNKRSSGSRSLLPASPTSAPGTSSSPGNTKSVKCVFPVLGTCSCFATDAKLKVTFSLKGSSFQIGRDAIAVSCAITSNTSKKAIRGVKVQFIQTLTFETAEAKVTMCKTLTEKEIAQSVAPGKSGTIAGHTDVLANSENFISTMQTSGLTVDYRVRVELLASHIDQAYYEFENVMLCGAVLAGAVPPVGLMHFTALPRGRLTRREAYYAIPMNPCEAPVMAELNAPLSVHGSRAVSRRTSRLNSVAVTPV